MFPQKVFVFALLLIGSTSFVSSVEAEVEVEDATGKPGVAADERAGEDESGTVSIKDLDLAKIESSSSDNSTNMNTRRWAPYPGPSQQDQTPTNSQQQQSYPFYPNQQQQQQQQQQPSVSQQSFPSQSFQPQPTSGNNPEFWNQEFWPLVAPSTNNFQAQPLPVNSAPAPQGPPQGPVNPGQPQSGFPVNPTSNNLGQNFATERPNFQVRPQIPATQPPQAFRPIGQNGNVLNAFSPEDGKTGVERPALPLGLPSFRREDPQASTTTANPTMFPTTNFYEDDNVEPQQQQQQQPQQPLNPETSSESPMSFPFNNAGIPQQQNTGRPQYPFQPLPQQQQQPIPSVPTQQQPFLTQQQQPIPSQQQPFPTQQQQPIPSQQQPADHYPMPSQQQPAADPPVPESIGMGEKLIDAHNAFGKELAEYIMKCEDGRGSSQTQIPKNFGPFYILAGAYPGQLING